MKPSALVLTALALSNSTVAANETDERYFFPTEEEKNMPFFDRGSWVSNVHIAHYGPDDPDNRDIEMTLLNIGATKYLWKNVGFTADAYLMSTTGDILVNDDTNWFEANSAGIGGSFGLKWHFLRGENWSLYLKGAVGLMFTDRDFPPGGTRWNFTERADVGLTVRLKDQLHLAISGSWLHASNGKGFNSGNPAYDGQGGYIGLVYRFDTLGWFTREANE